jgi:hypothetical protein
MLQTDYNDFLAECADSALSAVTHHEKMMKYADEQIEYWQQYRQREQTPGIMLISIIAIG